MFRTALSVVVLVAYAGSSLAADDLDARQRLRRTPVVEVFEKTRDAVVNISCTQRVERPTGPADLFELFRSPTSGQRVTSVGSGFVIHEDGYVITNAHVVLQTVDQRVIFVDGSEYKATPVAIDTSNDLAVLKINADRPLHALPLGRSDDLMIGETVIAIGNPLGYHHTVTTGVVSALNRTLTFARGVEYRGLIQTDASINPGNSGGPLLNVLGELIGINTAIRGDAQNIGFAIPVDELRRELPNMLSLERRRRIEVGMNVRGREVVRVIEVRADGPADRAGIEPGDRLLQLDGKPLDEALDFYFGLLDKTADDHVRITYERDGVEHEAVLTLRAIPIPDGAKLARELFGLELAPLPMDLQRLLHLDGGLVVTDVEPESDADRRGIERGMVIVAIGGYYARDLAEVGLLLEHVQGGDVVVFHLHRIEQFRDHIVIRSLEDVQLRAR